MKPRSELYSEALVEQILMDIRPQLVADNVKKQWQETAQLFLLRMYEEGMHVGRDHNEKDQD